MRRRLDQLARLAPVVTLENEFVDAGVLEALERRGARVLPGPACVRVVQDKLLQKQALASAELPVPRFCAVEDPADLRQRGRRARLAIDAEGAPRRVRRPRQRRRRVSQREPIGFGSARLARPHPVRRSVRALRPRAGRAGRARARRPGRPVPGRGDSPGRQTAHLSRSARARRPPVRRRRTGCRDRPRGGRSGRRYRRVRRRALPAARRRGLHQRARAATAQLGALHHRGLLDVAVRQSRAGGHGPAARRPGPADASGRHGQSPRHRDWPDPRRRSRPGIGRATDVPAPVR